MKLDFKQPKYVLPVILLPFVCFFFYLWQTSFARPAETAAVQDGLNPTVAPVSSDIQHRQLADKLDAFRNTYKEASGTSAVNAIPAESATNPGYNDPFVKRQQDQQLLDSVSAMARQRFGKPPATLGPDVDRAVRALMTIPQPPSGSTGREAPPVEKDPMELFRQQMAYMDSVGRESDPEVKAARLREAAAKKLSDAKAAAPVLAVTKATAPSATFQTLMPERPPAFISAAIDENVTGYSGSRLRLRLLEDIKAGNILIRKGTSVYALVSGFSEQRVMLTVAGILYEDKILPVNLQLYDLDGMQGLYVPASAFRDFTKDLGGNTVQGVSIGGASGNSQFVMSAVDKVFQSTSSAIAALLRKNKAHLKYNTYIYLIDPESLQNAQKNY